MLIKSNSPFSHIFNAKCSNLYYDFRKSLLTFSDKAGCPPTWCPSRLHSLLGAVTFTVAANCPPAACSRKEAHFARSHLFSQRTNSHDSCTLIPDVPRSQTHTHTRTDTTRMYGHRQPRGSEIFINPLWASSWKQGHYFCHCLKKKKKKKWSLAPTEEAHSDKLLEVWGAGEWSWSYVLLWVTSRVSLTDLKHPSARPRLSHLLPIHPMEASYLA